LVNLRLRSEVFVAGELAEALCPSQEDVIGGSLGERKGKHDEGEDGQEEEHV
jgi:hypothetical protein